MSDDIAKGVTRPGLSLLLHDLRSPVNIGMILRVAETFGVGVALMGRSGVLADEAKRRTISDFACGALERQGFSRPSDLGDVLRGGVGRLIATSIETGAQSLPRFAFRPGDVVVLGNEYDGLPTAVATRCHATLRIPMADVWTPKPASHDPIDPSRAAPVARDGMPNLNVAIAGGIICYQWFVSQTGLPDPD